jgi:hypothetical protein
MKFLFENFEKLANFTSCNDINTSGIPRFAISPLFTSTQIYVNANGKHNEFGIYPATEEVNEYVIASCVNHSPDDWTGYDVKVKSFFHYINEKYLRDLRAGKAFLMLDQSLEGYQTPWLWDFFHKECQEWDISPTRIIYVTGNMIADTVYEKWCNDNNINIRMKVIPYPHFELDMGMTTWGRNKENSENKLPSFSQNINYKIQNPNQLKTYACLNKRIRPHRVWFYYYLYNSGLLNDGLVSMNEFDKHWYNWEGKHFEQGELDECSSVLPLLVYETPNNTLDDNIYINRFPEQVVKDTFFTVVSEAHCGDSDQTMFLSEKTFKVIGCRHPFLIMGNKDSMSMMRKIGYKTFDGFIDERFDTLPTHERLNYIIDSIRKTTMIKDKIEWYKSMEDIIEYNYNTLIDKLFRYPDAYVEMRDYCKITTEKRKMI